MKPTIVVAGTQKPPGGRVCFPLNVANYARAKYIDVRLARLCKVSVTQGAQSPTAQAQAGTHIKKSHKGRWHSSGRAIAHRQNRLSGLCARLCGLLTAHVLHYIQCGAVP